MHLMIRDREDLRRYLARANVAATLHDRPGETLTAEARATQVLDVLRESGALCAD